VNTTILIFLSDQIPSVFMPKKRSSLKIRCSQSVMLRLACPLLQPHSRNVPINSNWPTERLFTEPSVSSFRLHIESFETSKEYDRVDGMDRTEILASLANCVELTQVKLMDKGVH